MIKVLKSCLFIILIFCFSTGVLAQEKKKEEYVHSPKKAVLLALALPGSGQIYNKKYWKLPLVYGGLIGSVSYTIFNHNKFKEFDEALAIRNAGKEGVVDKFVGKYDDESLSRITLEYRNERDRGILITAGVYILQMVDAYVDAHLFDFDISDDLSLNVSPSFNYDIASQNMQTGLSLNFNLR